jgi:hypothetical protein
MASMIPIVDDRSEGREESVLAVGQPLRERKFIEREEVTDYSSLQLLRASHNQVTFLRQLNIVLLIKSDDVIFKRVGDQAGHIF